MVSHGEGGGELTCHILVRENSDLVNTPHLRHAGPGREKLGTQTPSCNAGKNPGTRPRPPAHSELVYTGNAPCDRHGRLVVASPWTKARGRFVTSMTRGSRVHKPSVTAVFPSSAGLARQKELIPREERCLVRHVPKSF